jgi:hypothetical protein
MSTHSGSPFGKFLRTDPDLLAVYRGRTGMLLADMPRLVAIWREGTDSEERDGFNPAEAAKWLLAQPGIDDQDFAELRTLAAIWTNGCM